MILRFKINKKEVWLRECTDGWLAEWMEKGKLKTADVSVEGAKVESRNKGEL